MAAAEAVDDGGDVGFRIEAVELGGLGDGVDDRRAFAAGVGAVNAESDFLKSAG